ncbi:MAG TPA: hypothetical protein VHO06_13090, partial [Polyangia bacterium]|nr:hypothetical protein [Polyangia bacterium]
ALAVAQDEGGLNTGSVTLNVTPTLNIGGAGGAAGNGATLIQDVQDGTLATGSVVSLSNIFVTGREVSGSNNVTLYVQEPQGITTAAHDYPEYAGVELFITNSQAAALAALSTIAPGDCISATGTISEFQNVVTEISNLSSLTKAATAGSCGTFPSPLSVPSTQATFADLATDTDTAAGDTAGARAEVYEDVLVSFSNVVVVSATASQFRVSASGGSTAQNLLVDPFLYSFTVPGVTTTYSRLTGVYTEFGIGGSAANFRLQPRDASDLMP